MLNRFFHVLVDCFFVKLLHGDVLIFCALVIFSHPCVILTVHALIIFVLIFRRIFNGLIIWLFNMLGNGLSIRRLLHVLMSIFLFIWLFQCFIVNAVVIVTVIFVFIIILIFIVTLIFIFRNPLYTANKSCIHRITATTSSTYSRILLWRVEMDALVFILFTVLHCLLPPLLYDDDCACDCVSMSREFII